VDGVRHTLCVGVVGENEENFSKAAKVLLKYYLEVNLNVPKLHTPFLFLKNRFDETSHAQSPQPSSLSRERTQRAHELTALFFLLVCKGHFTYCRVVVLFTREMLMLSAHRFKDEDFCSSFQV
jgi:hypothetical protein